MNHYNTILVRRGILAQLEAAYPVSLPTKTLKEGLLLSGFELEANFLEKQIEYLREKNLLEIIAPEICPAFKRVKITALGIDYLQKGDC